MKRNEAQPRGRVVELAMLDHPLFPYVLRAVNDINDDLEQYVPMYFESELDKIRPHTLSRSPAANGRSGQNRFGTGDSTASPIGIPPTGSGGSNANYQSIWSSLTAAQQSNPNNHPTSAVTLSLLKFLIYLQHEKILRSSIYSTAIEFVSTARQQIEEKALGVRTHTKLG